MKRIVVAAIAAAVLVTLFAVASAAAKSEIPLPEGWTLTQIAPDEEDPAAVSVLSANEDGLPSLFASMNWQGVSPVVNAFADPPAVFQEYGVDPRVEISGTMLIGTDAESYSRVLYPLTVYYRLYSPERGKLDFTGHTGECPNVYVGINADGTKTFGVFNVIDEKVHVATDSTYEFDLDVSGAVNVSRVEQTKLTVLISRSVKPGEVLCRASVDKSYWRRTFVPVVIK